MDKRPLPRVPGSGHYEVASDEGAENWAVLATLIECCKLHGVNPNHYLTDVLTRLVNGHLASRVGELTPWAWSAANCQHQPSSPGPRIKALRLPSALTGQQVDWVGA